VGHVTRIWVIDNGYKALDGREKGTRAKSRCQDHVKMGILNRSQSYWLGSGGLRLDSVASLCEYGNEF